jgi:tetratricopeptide (TPR) repeat protein
MAEKMVTPFIEDFIGMGFFIEKRGNALYFGHGGANEGFRSQLLVHKTKGYGAVVMVNSDNGQIISEIIRSIARAYNWDEYLPQIHETISLDPGKLDEYVGRFKVDPDRVLKVIRENGKLYGEPTDHAKIELFPLSETHFITNNQDARFTFVKNSSGKVDSVQIRFRGEDLTAPRIAGETMIPYEMLTAGKIAEAMEEYRKIKRESPQNGAVGEGRLNALGYSLMRQKRLAEAIAIFRLNVEFYPNSSNLHDSLGEAYMMNGDKDLAIASYRKSVELNPQNRRGIQMLKKLEGK